jgi:hypothetical protein
MLFRRTVPSCLAPLVALAAACSVDRPGPAVQGSGIAAEEERPVGSFQAVAFAIPGTLMIRQDGAESLHIEADDNVLPHVLTEVRDGRLVIRSEARRLDSQTPIRVTLSADRLESIENAASGRIEATALQANSLSLTVAGSGRTYVEHLEVDLLRARVAGSGHLRVSGEARRQEVTLAGSGDLDGRELQSAEARVNIAGSGSATLTVHDELEANLLGSGSLRYFGSPRINSRTVGSGRIVPADG